MTLRVGLGRAGQAAVQAGQAHGAPAARQANRLADFGDGSDLRVLAFVPRHEEDTLFVPDIDGDGHAHVRKDDHLVQRNKQQATQHFTLLI